MVVDVGEVKRYLKPKADSTLSNMRKADLIKYIRCLEHNYNVAVSFNNQQAENIDTLVGLAFAAGCNWGYGVELSADLSAQEAIGLELYLGRITEEEAFRRKSAVIEEADRS